MPKTGQNLCPNCGTPAKDLYKAWELIAPFPDIKGRIPLTIFGMYECPVRQKIQGVASKAKLSAEGIEL